MSPNNGILLNGVLITKILNNPFASCSFINHDFLLLYIAHFDDNSNLPFLVFTIFESIFFVFLFYFKQYVNIFAFIILLITFLLCFCFRNLELSENKNQICVNSETKLF